MGKPQVRLDKDVAKEVQRSAALNSRTLPKEVNHILRGHYASASAKTVRK